EAAPPRRLGLLAEAHVLHVESEDAVDAGAAFGRVEDLGLGAAEVARFLHRRTADLVRHAAVVAGEGAGLRRRLVEQGRLLLVGRRGVVRTQPLVPAADRDVGQLAVARVEAGRILGAGKRSQHGDDQEGPHSKVYGPEGAVRYRNREALTGVRRIGI